MSWDIYIQDLPKNITSIQDIGDDFKPKPLGKKNEIIQKIKTILPHVDFSDPSWGIFENENFSIEFNLGNDKICQSIGLHVRGEGEAPTLIQKILDHLNYQALDAEAGDIFKLDQAKKSFKNWQNYRK